MDDIALYEAARRYIKHLARIAALAGRPDGIAEDMAFYGEEVARDWFEALAKHGDGPGNRMHQETHLEKALLDAVLEVYRTIDRDHPEMTLALFRFHRSFHISSLYLPIPVTS